MFQNAKGGVSRKLTCRMSGRMILGAVLCAFSFAAPLAAQSRSVELPDFQTIKGLAILSGPEGPSLTQIAAQMPAALRLRPLSPEARGVVRLSALPTSAAPRLQGTEQALTAGNQPVPEDLPVAVQTELKRIGCYSGGIDGDWGNGSRRAMERFYAAKKLEKGEVEPTEIVWRSLLGEAERTCKPEPVAVKKPTTTTKSTTTTAPTEAAPKPSSGGSPSCKFIGIAIICS